MKRRKDGRFQKVITIDGKKHFFYSSAATSRAAEKDIANQLLTYKDAKKKGKLFSVIADEWYEEREKKVAYTTAHRYESLKNHSKNHFEGEYIRNITLKDIERFGAVLSANEYSTKTIKDIISVLRMIFKYSYINGYINNDVTMYISPPKGKPAVHREALTDGEIEIVKNNVDIRDGFLPYFLLYTGLRKGEALALQFKDINIKKREIYVTKSVYHESNIPKIKEPKTASGKRTVIMLDVVADKFPKGKPNDYIFSIDGKRPFANSAFERHWKKYCEATKLNITPHQLRHTYATILFEAGIDVKDAQNLMGHSDIAVTRNIYTHIRENRMEQTAMSLNKFVSQKLVNEGKQPTTTQ